MDETMRINGGGFGVLIEKFPDESVVVPEVENFILTLANGKGCFLSFSNFPLIVVCAIDAAEFVAISSTMIEMFRNSFMLFCFITQNYLEIRRGTG
jgi:hypothetical protein